MSALQMLFLMLSGFGAGIIGALFGLGGGILIIPILVLVLKVPMHNAIATSLLCVIATSSAAASKNVARGIANVRLGITLEVWTVAGAMVGGLIAGYLPGRVLMLLFAAAMLVMAVPMSRGLDDEEREQDSSAENLDIEPVGFMNRLRGEYFDPSQDTTVSYRLTNLPTAMGVSVLAGGLSGLLGVGGGILKVPVLSLYCSIPLKAAAATSNFMIGVTAAASAIVYYGRGDVSPLITGASVVGVFLGSRTGSVLATHVHPRKLRKAFALLMAIIAIQMFWKAITGNVR